MNGKSMMFLGICFIPFCVSYGDTAGPGMVFIGVCYISRFLWITTLIVLSIISIFDKLLRIILLVCVVFSILLIGLFNYNNPRDWSWNIMVASPVILFFEILSLITYGIIKFVRWWKNRGAASEEAENLG
jgi:hypothetical protein